MMKSREMRRSIFALFSFILISVYANICVGKVLFEEDFEELDTDIWNLEPTWFVDDGVLHTTGGEVGITVRDDFTDFEYYADFNMVSEDRYSAQLVMRAQDKNNSTLVQVVFDDRNQIWWFTRVGGGYIVNPEDQLENESGLHPDLDEWYTMKVVAEGNRYEFHLGEQGGELELSCTWEDDTHSVGSIGFRTGGVYCMYDNVLVTTVGHNFAVNPHNSLPTVWGGIKGGE